MEGRILKIGTRGSALAVAQTGTVAACLTVPTEIITITTKGDVNQAPIPLDTIGKAWFTEEIEQALLAQRIDFAIHSLKDLPPELPEGLAIVPVLPRADARDVLVSKVFGQTLATLPQGAVIGTDSIRRKALLLAERPDLVVQSIRGNIDTRLRKLKEEGYDAIVIAAAGLARLDRTDVIAEYFDPTVFVPAAGQGVLAAEYRTEDAGIASLLQNLIDPDTMSVVWTEQAFSDAVGGGCKLPVGCYARIAEGQVYISGMVGEMDATHVRRGQKEGPVAEGPALARALAQELMSDA